jgi:lysophospholipase L1-like esterase
MKKRILCFGDSNTYGHDLKLGRFDEDTRWTMRLADILGEGYTVVEEGLNGRTFIHEDLATGGHKNGMSYLPACLMTHNPLDLVVIMLGTNDIKQRFGMTAHTIAQCAHQMVDLARRYAVDASGAVARVLLVSPIHIADDVDERIPGGVFGPKAAEISRGLAREYHRIATLAGCDFWDAAKHATPNREDAIHITLEGQETLARALADKIRTMNK